MLRKLGTGVAVSSKCQPSLCRRASKPKPPPFLGRLLIWLAVKELTISYHNPDT